MDCIRENAKSGLKLEEIREDFFVRIVKWEQKMRALESVQLGYEGTQCINPFLLGVRQGAL